MTRRSGLPQDAAAPDPPGPEAPGIDPPGPDPPGPDPRRHGDGGAVRVQPEGAGGPRGVRGGVQGPTPRGEGVATPGL